MQRITISIDEDLAARVDAYIGVTGAMSRSEVIRDLVRRGLSTRPEVPRDAHCFGILSCTVDQSVRALAVRVPQGRLDRHDQIVSALSVPLDHSTSIDVTVMRGRVGEVSAYAEALFLERGVMHGSLNLVPVTEDPVAHAHPADPHAPGAHEDEAARPHSHLRVTTGF